MFPDPDTTNVNWSWEQAFGHVQENSLSVPFFLLHVFHLICTHYTDINYITMCWNSWDVSFMWLFQHQVVFLFTHCCSLSLDSLACPDSLVSHAHSSHVPSIGQTRFFKSSPSKWIATSFSVLRTLCIYIFHLWNGYLCCEIPRWYYWLIRTSW